MVIRRANFTATSMKKTDFTNSDCKGAYFIKAVAAGTKFVVRFKLEVAVLCRSTT